VLEIAEIFRAHGHAYRQAHALSRDQRAVMRAIEICRTAVLGGHLDVCERCGYERPAYNSCLMGSVCLWRVQPVKGRCSRRLKAHRLTIKVGDLLVTWFG